MLRVASISNGSSLQETLELTRRGAPIIRTRSRLYVNIAYTTVFNLGIIGTMIGMAFLTDFILDEFALEVTVGPLCAERSLPHDPFAVLRISA